MFNLLFLKFNKMDLFKKAQNHYCGIGGLKCRCCNWTAKKKGRKEPSFNKLARKKLKTLTEKEISQQLSEI